MKTKTRREKAVKKTRGKNRADEKGGREKEKWRQLTVKKGGRRKKSAGARWVRENRR